MGEWTCEIEGATIILLGNLNPSIFQPAWLAAHDLIRKEESDAAKIGVIAPQIAQFTLDWLSLEVTEERFLASTTDPSYYEPLRDLVLGIFTLLEHTPLKKMGINRQMHYRMPSVKRWHAFGHLLTPKNIWEQIIESPGMRSLTIQGNRIKEESSRAEVNVKVEPSAKVDPGIFISVNNHFEDSSTDAPRKLMSILKDRWSELQAYAVKIAWHLLEKEGLNAEHR